MTQPLMFNSVLPWRLHGHRQVGSRDLALIVLWLHQAAESFFGEIVANDERKNKIRDLLVEHQDFLLKIAHFRTSGTRLEARDIVQITNARVLECWFQWRGIAFKPWLREILESQFLKEMRRERIRTGVDLSEQAWQRVEDQAAGTGADAVVASLDFDKTLTYLSPEHQEILRLRMDGFSYEELAEALGIPKGTAMSRLKRARDKYDEYANLDKDRAEA